VDVEVQDDVGLLGLALDARLPCHRLPAHVLSPLSGVVNRTSAARPWPASPSTSVSAARWTRAAASPGREYSITLARLTKSSTPSGDEKRAVPAVGRT